MSENSENRKKLIDQLLKVTQGYEAVVTCPENRYRVNTPIHLVETFCPYCVISFQPITDHPNN